MTQNAQSDYNEQEVYVRNGINAAVAKYHTESRNRGWWDVDHISDLEAAGHDAEFAIAKQYQRATKIALIHSEISEAMEGMRKNKMDDHLQHRKSVEVELADALIRIFDLAGEMMLDLGAAVVEKGRYNAIRADHNKDNRGRPDGKRF